MSTKKCCLILSLTFAGFLLGAVPASANERHFTYTYESAVLPPDGREFEVWNTARAGREDFYSAFDQRLEFEIGLTDRLQTSLYLNYGAVTAEGPLGVQSSFDFGGISNEWKLQLTDPVADPLGFAVYGEVGASTDEAEFEAKLIFDKRVGNVLFALNLVGEHEMEFGEESEVELEFEADLAATYFVTQNFSLGLEARTKSAVPEYEELEYSALWVGPAIAFAKPQWWVALSVLPQLPALAKEGSGTGPDLVHNEAVSARLLLSFHL